MTMAESRPGDGGNERPPLAGDADRRLGVVITATRGDLWSYYVGGLAPRRPKTLGSSPNKNFLKLPR